MRILFTLATLASLALPQEGRLSEWEPYVPLAVGDANPDCANRLGGRDGEAAVAAYELILNHGGSHAALDLKALRDGAPLLKRRVLTSLEPRDYGARRAGIILDALVAWDFAACPVRHEELESASIPILKSVRPEHADRLKELASRGSEDIQTLAAYAQALLGDAFPKKRAVLDFMGKSDWRLGASALVVARFPDAAAGFRIKELLASGEPPSIKAALTALPGFPDLDVRRELAKALEVDNPEVQALALRHIARGGIDMTETVWSLCAKGKFRQWVRECGFSRLPPFNPLEEVGPALRAADDPGLVDRLMEARNFTDAHVRLFDAILEDPPPKTRTRLLSMINLKAPPGAKRNPAAEFAAHRIKKSESMDEVLDLLEATASNKNSSHRYVLYTADPQTSAQKERLFGLCREWIAEPEHPLRLSAATTLHRWGVTEGTEDLFKIARAGGSEGFAALVSLGISPETVPLIREHLDGPQGYMALHLLARAKDESVIPRIIEAFKAGQFTYVGGDGGLGGLLKQFHVRDLTDDMVKLLDGKPHQAHIVSVISYLRWKGRKDKADLVRPYLSHSYGLVVEEAAEALADWKDPEAFEAMEKLLPKSDSDRSYWLLHAMMRLDPDRAWPHFRRLLAGFVQLQGLQRFDGVFPRSGDAGLVRRLLFTEFPARFPRIAGKKFGADVADALLLLAEDGNVDAATGLAYAGDRRGIDAIRVDRESPVQLLNALDLLVNAPKQPLNRAKSFEKGQRSGEVAAKQIKEAFGVEISFAKWIPPREVTFEAEQDLLESLERLGAGRFPRAHITRDGKIEFVPLPEARAHWIAWREKQK